MHKSLLFVFAQQTLRTRELNILSIIKYCTYLRDSYNTTDAQLKHYMNISRIRKTKHIVLYFAVSLPTAWFQWKFEQPLYKYRSERGIQSILTNNTHRLWNIKLSELKKCGLCAFSIIKSNYFAHFDVLRKIGTH